MPAPVSAAPAIAPRLSPHLAFQRGWRLMEAPSHEDVALDRANHYFRLGDRAFASDQWPIARALWQRAYTLPIPRTQRAHVPAIAYDASRPPRERATALMHLAALAERDCPSMFTSDLATLRLDAALGLDPEHAPLLVLRAASYELFEEFESSRELLSRAFAAGAPLQLKFRSRDLNAFPRSEVWQAVVQWWPESTTLQLCSALAIWRDGQLHLSAPLLRAVMQQEPRCAYAAVSLGTLYAKQSRWHEAKAVFAQAILADRTCAYAWENWFVAAIVVGEYEQAQHQLREFIAVTQDPAMSLYRLGFCFFNREGDAFLSFATLCFGQASSHAGDDALRARALLCQARMLQRSGALEQSLNSFERAFALEALPEKELSISYGCAAQVMALLRRDLEAHVAFDIALRAERLPNDIVLHAARASLRARKYNEANERLRRVLTSEPAHHEARCLLAETLLHLGSHAAALAIARAALLMQPTSVRARTVVGMVLAEMKRDDEAICMLTPAVTCSEPAAAPAYVALVEVFTRRNEHLLARDIIHCAQQIYPRDSQVHAQRGQLALLSGERDVAASAFLRAVRCDADSLEGWRGLLELSRDSEATPTRLTCHLNVMRLAPEDRLLSIELGFEALGAGQMAEVQQALAVVPETPQHERSLAALGAAFVEHQTR